MNCSFMTRLAAEWPNAHPQPRIDATTNPSCVNVALLGVLTRRIGELILLGMGQINFGYVRSLRETVEQIPSDLLNIHESSL